MFALCLSARASAHHIHTRLLMTSGSQGCATVSPPPLSPLIPPCLTDVLHTRHSSRSARHLQSARRRLIGATKECHCSHRHHGICAGDVRIHGGCRPPARPYNASSPRSSRRSQHVTWRSLSLYTRSHTVSHVLYQLIRRCSHLISPTSSSVVWRFLAAFGSLQSFSSHNI